MKLDTVQTDCVQVDNDQVDNDQVEKELLKILSELIDDRIWLDSVLKQNNLYPSDIDKTLLDNITLDGSQEVANRLIQSAGDVAYTEADLEETIIVSSDLSLQTYPYQKPIQRD